MLSNFKKIFIDHCPPLQEQQPFLSPSESQSDASDTERTIDDDTAAQQHRDAAMAETVYVSGCTCPSCAMRSETDSVVDSTCASPGSHVRRSLPSFRSVMEVLYPSSYLGTPSPFPDPPSYSQRDSFASAAQGDDSETAPLISSALSSPDPLTRDSLLSGVPSQDIPSTRVPLQSSTPIIILDNVSEEPLPAYSRFDQRRPRFPAASDILGPYPPMSVLCRFAR